MPTQSKIKGVSCAFRQLLRALPEIDKGLDDYIKPKLKDADYALLLSPKGAHGVFKDVLAEANWPNNRYPFTTDSVAYESLRRYFHQRVATLLSERQQRRLPPPRDLGLANPNFRALRAVQIDSHTLDVRGRIHISLDDQLIPIPVARVSVLVAVDVDTRCTLGFHVAYTLHPSQHDMLVLIDNIIQRWHPLEIRTPGLRYKEGACFPSGLDDPFPISFGVVQLDNALIHRAHSVSDILCEKYGATLNLGVPYMPEIRQLVESVFDYIEKHMGHRLPSTTGSYPTDPKKESRKNQKKPPLVTIETLEEGLSILLTGYNLRPVPAFGIDVTPLELFQYHCANHFVRYVPPELTADWQPLQAEQIVTLHWYAHENRMPHVNFHYDRYTGPGLVEAAGKHKRIRVAFNRKDIRTLHAYSLEGEDLGEIHASKPWRRYPHSMMFRAWFHKHAKAYRMNEQDPFAETLRVHLKDMRKPKVALSLLRFYNEFHAGSAVVMPSPEVDVSLIAQQSKYQWHSSNAYHGGDR